MTDHRSIKIITEQFLKNRLLAKLTHSTSGEAVKCIYNSIIVIESIGSISGDMEPVKIWVFTW